MTDEGESLSEIMSDAPAPAVVADTATSTTEAPASGQTRDEQGRFGPKGEAATAQQEPAAAEEQPGAMVPQQALHAARQENGDLKRRLDEMAGQISILTQQRPQPTPQVQAEQPKPKDFWEDPDGFVKQALSPLEKQTQRQFERVSRLMAITSHGEEKVSAAFTALSNALTTNPATTIHEYRRITAADHPYDEMVKWHQRSQALSRVGDNPDAFVQSEIDKMLADPTKAGELLKRLQAGATGQPAVIAPNRSTNQPPPSITRIPGGNASAESVPTLGEILKSGR